MVLSAKQILHFKEESYKQQGLEMNTKSNHQLKLNAERRYSFIRKQALSETEKVLKAKNPNLRLAEIDAIALREAEKWQSHPERIVDWNWFDLLKYDARRYPKRFEMATWNSNSLEALTLGRPTQSGDIIRLDYIEASPFERELKVLQISLIAMELYAELIGANKLRIMYPISHGVKKYYESYDYTYYQKGNLYFLWKRL